MTSDTLRMSRRMWATRPGHTVESAFVLSQSEYNYSLYAMLRHTVKRVTEDVLAGRPTTRITAHIHICGGSHQFIEPELNIVRRGTGVADSGVCSLIIQQGCAGLLFALDVANQLLASAATADDHVLITAENNMLYSGHLRALHTGSTNQDYNYWLWPAIFGEGVGAMVVGRPDEPRLQSSRGEWRVEHLCYHATDCDSPVVGPVRDRDGIGFKVLLQAKQVRQNYLQWVTRHALDVIRLAGGVETLHRLCLHESNPLLVREVAGRVGIPLDCVPTVSADVGTLACVSAFTLLKSALEERRTDRKSKVGCSLIGEAGGHLLSGYMCLGHVP